MKQLNVGFENILLKEKSAPKYVYAGAYCNIIRNIVKKI